MSESLCSGMSGMSVSFFGEEVGLEQALDTCFKDLQDHLNESHVLTRQLAMLSEQDGDWVSAVDLAFAIQERCGDMAGLFKELKSVVIQVRGKPMNDAEKKYLKDKTEAVRAAAAAAAKVAAKDVAEEKRQA